MTNWIDKIVQMFRTVDDSNVKLGLKIIYCKFGSGIENKMTCRKILLVQDLEKTTFSRYFGKNDTCSRILTSQQLHINFWLLDRTTRQVS